ncbi:zinc finger protein 37-like isoform X2 [Hyposmocoma kahamanoa]|uniref:zinc finger protein 37-like isoform X2 n=1 Tax=Hyposmocoma kahamanoa TaxID=1477025 RepID=UPI000E6D7AA3|nr:zinc finger protein 37-like isoform X2 [Hyposmocoma kahamanoa]
MSGLPIRFVNVVPNVKIKQELPSDDEDDVACKICSKAFASEVALRNHARMEHIDAFATGDPDTWTQDKADSIPKERKRKAEKIETDRAEKVAPKRDREVKEPQPITGPFECLQPSTLVADGTCHQIFFSCCDYSVHFRDEHTRRRKGLRCQVCEKPLLGNGEEPTSPYSCEVCGMGFQTNKELSAHMATDHIKLKPFECSVCHKRFTQQGGVQQHMRMHTGDRPFSCTFCPKAFTQKSGLDQHLRIHTKVKPYRCVVCSKTFCQSVHLKQHMRTHTNVSPFQCGICQKRFKQSSHLNYHLKNHNPQNMSEEQKIEYNKLINIMNEDKANSIDDDQRIEVEVEETIEETEVMIEQEEIEQEQIDQEQMMAEQSIQVEEGEETYILSDNGNEVWSVHIAEQ